MNPRAMRLLVPFLLLVVASGPTIYEVESFVLFPPHRSGRLPLQLYEGNFLSDMLQSAFANDNQLLSQSNKRAGMLDEALDGDNAILLTQPPPTGLTATQQAWRQSMGPSSTQVQASDVIGSTVTVDLYLTGVPNKDPSNDLYASRINISARDRSVGQVVPTQPTLTGIDIQFLPNCKCRVLTAPENAAAFVNTNIEGDWKLSDDGRQLRCRVQVYGFQRTVQTKGTIQKIYWSQEQESITETSTVYSIPTGWLYLEMDVSQRRRVLQWNPGVLKIEQAMGMFGVASRMAPCGKFVVASAFSSSSSCSSTD